MDLGQAQARVDKLQTACDEAFSVLTATPSSGLNKERVEQARISLRTAEGVLKSLAAAASPAGGRANREIVA